MSSRIGARRLIVAAAALLSLAAAAGCQSSTAAPSAGTEQATMTVTDGVGKTVEIPREPQRALGFYTTDLDILITLGIPLAPLQPIRGDGYTDFPSFFPQEELSGIETYGNYPEYNYEKALEAKPDLILNGLGYDADAVARLPEIAPTYSVDAFDGKDWRVAFEETARNLGRTEQYQAWVDGYQQQLQAAKTELTAAGAYQRTVAVVGYHGGEFSLGCYGVPCRTLRDDLELPVAEQMLSEEATLSAEQLSQLEDVDVVFMSRLPGPEGKKAFEQQLAELDKIPTWRSLDFVQNNQIYTYDMEMVYGSPSGQTAFLDVARKALAE